MSNLRIASLLPAATEMACALGLADRLVGISHECAYPPSIGTRPRLSRSVLPVGLTQGDIDAFVAARLHAGESLYEVDATLLRELEPTHILTQDLCPVCGVSSRQTDEACAWLPGNPRVLRFSPKSLTGIHENLRALGVATGRADAAERLIADAHDRVARVQRRVAAAHRPRVFCLEWLDPPYCSGHWIPEMVECAGGIDALGRKGADSVRIDWREIVEWAPEVLILMPCGYGVEAIAAGAAGLKSMPGWKQLPAVRDRRVFVVDADAYFARPGPRITVGIELLARIIHPELAWPAIETSAAAVEFGAL